MWPRPLVARLAEHSRRVLSQTRTAARDPLTLDEFGPPGPAPGGAGAFTPVVALFSGYTGDQNSALTFRFSAGETPRSCVPLSYGDAGAHRLIDLTTCVPRLDIGDLIVVLRLATPLSGESAEWICIAPSFIQVCE